MGPEEADKGTPAKSERNEEENGEQSRLAKDRKIRYEIVKSIFDEVLDANLHQSEISARILIPVAFLTAATISLFKLLFDMSISHNHMKDSIPILLLLLVLYIIFTVGGILIFLEVIGPSFFTEIWPIPTGKQEGLKSALFFKYIAETNIDKWMDHLCKKESKEFLKIEELQDKLIYDYTVESSLLAKKAQGKVKDNLFAHLFFYPSFCCLLLMACIGVLSYLNVSGWIILGSIVLIVHVFIYIEIQVFRKYRKEAGTFRKALEKESKKK